MNIALLVLTALSPQLQPTSAAEVAPSRPNILLICVDDLRPELGCFGAEHAISPNIDALAARGRAFTRHYVQAPTCGASRYGLLSGRRPTHPAQLGNHFMIQHMAQQPEGDEAESFVHHFRRNGYHTVGVGKISHSSDGLASRDPDARELPHSWDRWHAVTGKWGKGDAPFFGFADGSNRNTRKYEVPPFEAGEVDDQGYPDGLHTELALAELRRCAQSEQSFLLAVGFFKPHLPFNAPKKYWDLYERDSIPVSANPELPGGASRPFVHDSAEFFQRYKLGREFGGAGKVLSEEYAREIRHAYLACVSYIDAQVGLLLAELDTLGLSDNTIVVLWGDHGWHLGDQTIWGKHSLFERALRSPLILAGPGIDQAGQPSDTLAASIDLYPTLCDWSGVQPPAGLDGVSLLPVVRDAEHRLTRPVFGYQRNGVSMRTETHRLMIQRRKGEWQIALFDHRVDPFEKNGLAASAVNAQMVQAWNAGRLPWLPEWESD